MTKDRRDLRPYLRRLHNPATGLWLHLSGHGETADINYSWRGTRDQAATLRQRATARGDEWPYEIAAMEQVREGQ